MNSDDSAWLMSPPELKLLSAEERALDAIHEAGHALICVQLEGSVTEMNLLVDEGGRGGTICTFEGQPSGHYAEWSSSELQLAATELTKLSSGGVVLGWVDRHVTMIYAGWVAEIIGGYTLGQPVTATKFAVSTRDDNNQLEYLLGPHSKNGEASAGVAVELRPGLEQILWLKAWQEVWTVWPAVLRTALELLRAPESTLKGDQLAAALIISDDCMSACSLPGELAVTAGWSLPLKKDKRQAIEIADIRLTENLITNCDLRAT